MMRFRSLSTLLVAPFVALASLALAAPSVHAEEPSKTESASDKNALSRPDLLEAALEASTNGLTADEVVSRALQTSPQVKSAGLQAGKAEQNRSRATLGFAPRVDLQGRYTHLSFIKLPKFELGGQTFSLAQVLNQYSATASVSLPITDWFLTVLPTYRAATKMATVAEHQKHAVELEVSYNARVAFYDFARARGAQVVAEDSVRLLEAAVKDLESLVAAGVATQTDLLKTKAQLGDRQAFRDQVAGASEVAAVRLSQLLGAPVDATRGIGEALVGFEIQPAPPVDQVLGIAKTQRPEVLALRMLAHVRTDLAKARRGAQYPQLKAFADEYYANPNTRVVPQQPHWKNSWDMGVMISWSPNDATYAHMQASDADVDVALARQDLLALEDAITVEAAAVVSNHRAAREQVDAKNQLVEAARRYYNDQHALMLAGATTPNEVLRAENELRQAELQWIDAFIQVRMASAALLKVQGQTGLPKAAGNAP